MKAGGALCSARAAPPQCTWQPLRACSTAGRAERATPTVPSSGCSCSKPRLCQRSELAARCSARICSSASSDAETRRAHAAPTVALAHAPARAAGAAKHMRHPPSSGLPLDEIELTPRAAAAAALVGAIARPAASLTVSARAAPLCSPLAAASTCAGASPSGAQRAAPLACAPQPACVRGSIEAAESAREMPAAHARAGASAPPLCGAPPSH